MKTLTMDIQGMTCGHCVAGVTRALKDVTGVTVDDVKIGSATVQYDDSLTAVDDIRQAVEDEGYAVVSAA